MRRIVTKVEHQGVGSIFKPQTKSFEVPIGGPSRPLPVPAIQLIFENRIAVVSYVRAQVAIIFAVRQQVIVGSLTSSNVSVRLVGSAT
jgi:hypothetical protein